MPTAPVYYYKPGQSMLVMYPITYCRYFPPSIWGKRASERTKMLSIVPWCLYSMNVRTCIRHLRVVTLWKIMQVILLCNCRQQQQHDITTTAALSSSFPPKQEKNGDFIRQQPWKKMLGVIIWTYKYTDSPEQLHNSIWVVSIASAVLVTSLLINAIELKSPYQGCVIFQVDTSL